MTNSVVVNIALSSTPLLNTNFDVGLILGSHNVFPQLVRTYTAASQLVDDGFSTSDPIYLAAQDAFSQTPSARTIKIGKITPYTKSITLTPVDDGNSFAGPYLVSLNGTQISGVGTSLATLLEDLETKLQALSVPNVTITDTGTTITIVADVAGTFVDVDIDPEFFSYADTSLTPDIAADYAAIKAVDDAFFALTLADPCPSAINALAPLVGVDRRPLFADIKETASTENTSTLDIASTLAASSTNFVTLYWDNLSAKAMGNVLGQNPLNFQLKFKQLSGAAKTPLSTTRLQALQNKNVNILTRQVGVTHVVDGNVSSGDFVENIVGIEKLSANIRQAAFGAYASRQKLPITDEGAALIVSAIDAEIQAGITAGFVRAIPAPQVQARSVRTLTVAEKSARNLPKITFTFTIASGVKEATVNGTVIQ